MPSVWRIHAADPERSRALAGSLGIHPVTAQLLLNRGLTDRARAERFLEPRLGALADPRELPDMDRATRRIRRAIATREPILIFGDSDVDGLSAGVILDEVLSDLGAHVRARSSNRITGGYGLPQAIVHEICRSATKLLILVDCGTNQPDAIRQLAERGIDTIIVDHHVPLEGWARPCALVNPRSLAGAGQELCSAGLALKLTQALLEDDPTRLLAWLDLAALGTLADCVPLIEDNRVIVSEGLERIVGTERPGLSRLCHATKTKAAEPEQILRRLIPRLNASGRLGDASAVWHALRRQTDDRLDGWLASAEAAHQTTKQLHRQMIAQAQEQVNRLHFRDQYVMVVSQAGWHQGLTGPLASQLAARYGRPAIAIAMDERLGVGSGRSIPVFNLLEALHSCQEFLLRYGGHAQACGLTVDRKHLEQFRALVNEAARRSLGREGLVKVRMVDLELPLGSVARGWVDETARLAPFGQGNPRPTVALRRVTIEIRSPRTATLSDGTHRVPAKGSFFGVDSGSRYDVLASPGVVEGTLVLTVSDVRGAAAPSGPVRT
jgi:single-stranded-DNA-specific exonuclease